MKKTQIVGKPPHPSFKRIDINCRLWYSKKHHYSIRGNRNFEQTTVKNPLTRSTHLPLNLRFVVEFKWNARCYEILKEVRGRQFLCVRVFEWHKTFRERGRNRWILFQARFRNAERTIPQEQTRVVEEPLFFLQTCSHSKSIIFLLIVCGLCLYSVLLGRVRLD